MRLRPLPVIALALIGLLAGCGSTAPAHAPALGAPLNAATTYRGDPISHIATVETCRVLISDADAAAALAEAVLNPSSVDQTCGASLPGRNSRIFMGSRLAQVAESVQIMTSADTAHAALPLFMSAAVSFSLLVLVKEQPPTAFSDLGAEVHYLYGEEPGTGLFTYGLAIRQGTALIAVSAIRRSPMPASALHALGQAALNHLTPGVQPYIAPTVR